ncbi:hypothetical protein EVAR_4854_1 [Eumeta japonica]|uniref:Uncharacterized protein n=1 Tax=Eumeta variegata TaxID=151549 RepID=A0A4C1T1U1_EUMVA|nr:hypothetical protein EVAR_4854_1 [Eumeta japonica]
MEGGRIYRLKGRYGVRGPTTARDERFFDGDHELEVGAVDGSPLSGLGRLGKGRGPALVMGSSGHHVMET